MLKAGEVYNLVSKIHVGKVTTSSDIVKTLGHPRASRATGRILNLDPNPILTLCPRVIKSDGKIAGYSLGYDRKKGIAEER